MWIDTTVPSNSSVTALLPEKSVLLYTDAPSTISMRSNKIVTQFTEVNIGVLLEVNNSSVMPNVETGYFFETDVACGVDAAPLSRLALAKHLVQPQCMPTNKSI